MHSRSLGQIVVEMNKTKEFLIPFIGLKPGKHHFEYHINNTFFEIFDYHEFNNSNIKVNVVLEKKSTMLELAFKHKGTIHVPCDLTNEMFDFPIKGKIYNGNDKESDILGMDKKSSNLSKKIKLKHKTF